jgi:hypothetical protein
MRYIIAVTVFLLTTSYAEQSRVQSSYFTRIDNKEYKKDLNRLQMLKEAKFLTKKYKNAVSKFENWDMRKEELKKDFRKKNPNTDTSLGNGNEYGIKRAQKRRMEYYKSLDKQEIYLQTRVEEADAKLRALKDEFLFQFAVPLTDKEIRGGKPPQVTDRDEKVEMLNHYINEEKAYKRCKERVAHFESVKNVTASIEKLFPDTKLTTLYIDTKSSQNQDEIQEHLLELKRIDEEYKAKYGLPVLDAQRAKAIIQKIHSN